MAEASYTYLISVIHLQIVGSRNSHGPVADQGDYAAEDRRTWHSCEQYVAARMARR